MFVILVKALLYSIFNFLMFTHFFLLLIHRSASQIRATSHIFSVIPIILLKMIFVLAYLQKSPF